MKAFFFLQIKIWIFDPIIDSGSVISVYSAIMSVLLGGKYIKMIWDKNSIENYDIKNYRKNNRFWKNCLYKFRS